MATTEWITTSYSYGFGSDEVTVSDDVRADLSSGQTMGLVISDSVDDVFRFGDVKINGVEVEVEAIYSQDTAGTPTMIAQFKELSGGFGLFAISSQKTQVVSAYPNDAIYVLGSSSDQWSFFTADVHSQYQDKNDFLSNIYLEISNSSATSDNLRIDRVRMRLHYTPTPGMKGIIPPFVVPTIEGYFVASSEVDMELTGIDTANTERDIDAKGIATHQADRDIELTGKVQDNSERDVETTGQEPVNSERDFEVPGGNTSNSERDIETTGEDTSNSNVDIELTGAVSVNSERDLDIEGVVGKGRESRSFEVLVSVPTDSEISFELEGATDTSERNIETTGKITEKEDREIEIEGSVGQTSDRDIEVPADQPENDEREFEVVTGTLASGEVDIEITGKVQDKGNRIFEIPAKEQDNSERSIEIEGDTQTSTREIELTGGLEENTERSIELTGGIEQNAERSIEVPSKQLTNTDRSIEVEGNNPVVTYKDALISSQWAFEIYDENGRLLADLTGFAQMRRLDVARNRAGSCTFQIDLNFLHQYCSDINIEPENLIFVNKNEVRIRRGDYYLWGGQIQRYEADIPGGALSVQVIGYFDLLKERFLDAERSYIQNDAGAIAWDLINTTQTQVHGSFGILYGNIQSSKLRDRGYEKDKDIHEAIIQLSEVIDGFDFEVDVNKQFNVYYPKQGVRRENYLFIWTGNTGGNIKSLKVAKDGAYTVNRAKMRGKGFGPAQRRYELNDSFSQSTYSIREEIYDHADISDVGTLADHAEANLNVFSEPLINLDVTLDGNQAPYLGDYWLGDEIRIQIGKYSMFSDIQNSWYEIDAISVSLDENDQEEVKLTISKI